MTYEDEDRIEPEGAQLSVARRIVAQMDKLVGSTDLDEAHPEEDGVRLSMNYTESHGRCGEETYRYTALLPWEVLFNGDIIEWWCEAERAEIARRYQEEVQRRARAEEARRRATEEAAARKRRDDLETYERIRAEMEAGHG